MSKRSIERILDEMDERRNYDDGYEKDEVFKYANANQLDRDRIYETYVDECKVINHPENHQCAFVRTKTENLTKKNIINYRNQYNYYKFELQLLDVIKNHNMSIKDFVIQYLEDSSEDIKNNVSIISLATRINSESFKYASDEIKNSRDIIYELIYDDPMVLKYISDRLKDDFELVGEAVRIDGNVLRYASERLREDLDMQFVAMMNMNDECENDGINETDLLEELKEDIDQYKDHLIDISQKKKNGHHFLETKHTTHWTIGVDFEAKYKDSNKKTI